MIEGISGIPMVEEESPYAEKKVDKLGRDDFLKLFLAQLNHQDPLNPMDSTQFSAQLAQFSSLEQLFNVNDNLEAIQGAQSDGARFQALDLMGKEIEAEGDKISLAQGNLARGAFDLESRAECRVLISDGEGNPVREVSLGALGPGRHSFEWDGRDESGEIMEPGVYGFEVAARDDNGQTVTAKTRISGLVDRVNLEGDSPLLYVGDMSLGLSQVADIRVPDVEEGEATQ